MREIFGTLGVIVHMPDEFLRLGFSRGRQGKVLPSGRDPRAASGEIFDLPFWGSAAVGASPLEYGLFILATCRAPFGVGGFNRPAATAADPKKRVRVHPDDFHAQDVWRGC